MNVLNDALDHTLMMTHYMMLGKITEVWDDMWIVKFYTDDTTTPARVLEVEIQMSEGQAAGYVLNEFNMPKKLVAIYMDLLMEAIVLPGDSDTDPDDELEDPC